MQTKTFFIAGTDTDVGKTFVASGILQCANARGLSTAGYKPISAGCELTDEGLRNEDALVLQANSSLDLQYDEVNPIAFADPVAPHLAAKRSNTAISIEDVSNGYRVLVQKSPEFLLVEGAGGWRLPLDNNGHFLSDFVTQQKLPVILVVGMKLGCLNHAMLTIEAIERDGLKVVGWVANFVDPQMLYQEDNVKTLKSLIHAPCLGEVPFLENADNPAQYIDLGPIL